MKRKFKQCWSTIPPVSTKQTISCRIKSLNIKKDHDVGNPGPDLGPAQKYAMSFRDPRPILI